MAIICWGNLAKAADDTQKIEQAILGYVEGHNENVNAHQLEGSSLYMHRINEKLDHLQGSVNLKHLVNDHIVGMGHFESLDGWLCTSAATAGVLGAYLRTDGEEFPTKGWLLPHNCVGSNIGLDPTKNPFFQTTVYIPGTTNQIIYLVAGDAMIDEPFTAFGFKIVDNTLYAVWMKETTEYTNEISGFAPNGVHVYRVEFDSDTPAINFYVDGVLKYTATANLPTEGPPILFSYYIERTNEDFRYLYPIDWLFQQER